MKCTNLRVIVYAQSVPQNRFQKILGIKYKNPQKLGIAKAGENVTL